jgi:hypothetical protein
MNNVKPIHYLKNEDFSVNITAFITETKFAKQSATYLSPNVVLVTKVSCAKYNYLHYVVQQARGEVFLKQYSPLPSK